MVWKGPAPLGPRKLRPRKGDHAAEGRSVVQVAVKWAAWRDVSRSQTEAPQTSQRGGPERGRGRGGSLIRHPVGSLEQGCGRKLGTSRQSLCGNKGGSCRAEDEPRGRCSRRPEQTIPEGDEEGPPVCRETWGLGRGRSPPLPPRVPGAQEPEDPKRPPQSRAQRLAPPLLHTDLGRLLVPNPVVPNCAPRCLAPQCTPTAPPHVFRVHHTPSPHAALPSQSGCWLL